VIQSINRTLAISYVAGVGSEQKPLATILLLGTEATFIIDLITQWWAYEYMEASYGTYSLYYIGWRTLDERWHKNGSFYSRSSV